MDLDLRCGRTGIVIGEDSPLSLTVSNASGEDLTVIDPQRSTEWPKIRVSDMARGTERTFGPHDLERGRVHHVTPRTPPAYTTLGPGEAVTWEDQLLRWVEIPRAGSYELTLLMQGPRGVVASKPAALTVSPLKLASARIAHADGAGNPRLYGVWVHDGGERGAVVILDAVRLGEGGPAFLQSDRVAELAAPVSPVPSISPPRAPCPAHWLAYLSPRGLEGLHVFQGVPGIAAAPHRIDAPAARIVGPSVLGTPSETGTDPVSAHVAIWDPGASQVRLYTFEPDGQITPGQGVAVGPGTLAWGAATVLAGREARYALVMQERDAAEVLALLHVRGGSAPAAPVSVGRWRGAAIGAGMTLAGEAMIGAVVVREGLGSALALWAVARDGAVTLPPAVGLVAGLPLDRALVAVSPSGQVLVVAQTVGGGWVYGGRDGILRPLPDEAAAFGDPIDAQIGDHDTPFAVMAGAETGITYQALSGHGHGHGGEHHA